MTEKEILEAYTKKQRKVYLAGGMLTRGQQLQRMEEAELIRSLGHELYNPLENKSINDKTALKDEPLAERIVKHDTDAIKGSDVAIIEPLPESQGTVCELGQIHGRKMMAREILDVLHESTHAAESFEENLGHVVRHCYKVLDQQVFPHYEDIRRVEGITETGDRRSLGVNQYIYGVCLDLTDGKGFYEMSEIKEALSNTALLS